MSELYQSSLNCMTMKQLKKQLSQYGLSMKGNKGDLVHRLVEHFEMQGGRDNTSGSQEDRLEDSKPQAKSTTGKKALRRTHDVAGSPSTSQTTTGSKGGKGDRILSDEALRISKAERKAELKRQLQLLESSSDEDSESEEESDDEENSNGRDLKRNQWQEREMYDPRLIFEKLPAPTPPVFDGNVLMYSDWKIAFDGLIDHLPLRASQKFYYLKQYLSGKALNAVSSYFMTNTDRAYLEARRLLEKRFGDPFLLCREIQRKLRSWPRIATKDAEGLRNYSDFLAKCLTMKEEISTLGRLDDITEIQELTHKLPDWCANKWNDKAYDYRERHNDYPKFKKFVEFLRRESDKACDSVYSMTALRNLEPTPTRVEAKHKATTRRSSADAKPDLKKPITTPVTEKGIRCCSFCNGESHKLPDCTEFTKIPIADRQAFVQNSKLCFGCLVAYHRSRDCKRRETCARCSKKHPTVLHRNDFGPRVGVDSAAKSDSFEKADINTATAFAVNHPCQKQFSSMVVPVYISSKGEPSKEVLTYALLDTQSDTTFATRDTLENLNAQYENTQLKLSTMTSKDEVIKTRCYRDLQIRGYSGRKVISLSAVYTREYIPVIESHIPTAESVNKMSHLKHIAEFIPPRLDCEVGLLVGYDCSQALLPRRVESGSDSEPFAIETDLGWSVVGTHDVAPATTKQKDPKSTVCFRTKNSAKEVSTSVDILRILNQDFKDTDDDSVKGLSQDDLKFMKIIESGINQDDNGYYTMPLPLKDSYSLPDNRWMAEQRLNSLMKRLSKDKDFEAKYREFMDGVIQRSEAEVVTADSSQTKWYLPHHGVTHPRKPGKVRVVFDCSARCEGVSLNDLLLSGPDLNNTLLGVLLRFRLGQVALSCDVERMFFQFRVPAKDRDMLRFLWFDSTGNIVDYRMKVHLFGAASSPSCAIFALQRLAEDYGNEFPLAKRFILNHFYVDDGLISTDSVEEATQIAYQVREMGKRANIRLCKFSSTRSEVLSSIPERDHATNSKAQELMPQTTSALGITWLIESDQFCFSLKLKETPLTRRGILSMVSSIYDPLGLISPIMLIGKAILKDVCELGKDWDEELPDHIQQRWKAWKGAVINLTDVKFPRCIKPKGFEKAARIELHHFADASMTGYGCCSYMRQINTSGEVACNLLMAKSRVAPSKITTIPRLELQAATLVSKISRLLREELGISNIEEYYYTDSEIVLGYITNNAKRFHTFVANRVQQIKTSTDVGQWKHIRSDDNPADYASRGSTLDKLNDSNWFQGPEFLIKGEYIASKEIDTTLDTSDPEVKSSMSHAMTQDKLHLPDSPIVERLKKFSTLNSAVRAVEAKNRLCRRFKKAPSDCDHTPDQDYSMALNHVVLEFQREFYEEEIDLLSKGKPLHKKNVLSKLDPFLDTHGVLRVGGRLALITNIPDAEKHPIIVPRKSHLATLVVRASHDVHHQGRGITIGKIRENGFWIIGCTSVVKSYIHHCIICRRLRHQPQSQKMSDIPTIRAEEQGPFVCTGMDCFGPFQVKNGRKYNKVYGVIFTCLSSRAVHLELLDDLSSDSFINALRCLISIRGQVNTLVSDQGTNFKGACSELRDALKEMADGKFKAFVSQHMINFKFNAPTASHAGGVWERHIRTIRSILNTMLTKLVHPPDSTTMRVFLYEAMAIINGRPLAMSTLHDPMSLRPLTPNDILLMKTSVLLPPPGNFDEEYPRKRWRYVQTLTNQFWKRWKQQYVQELQVRQKWHIVKRNLRPGDIVLIKDENLVRGHWNMGRVEKVTAGEDGLVRRAYLALPSFIDNNGRRTGEVQYLERPVQKLILLVEGN